MNNREKKAYTITIKNVRENICLTLIEYVYTQKSDVVQNMALFCIYAKPVKGCAYMQISKGRTYMMERLNEIVTKVDDFVWGPVMLILLVGTGIFLTIRTKFLPWRNLGYALKSTLSKEARTKSRGEGDVSPFSALTTALAATIGTGNIVGVATAMVSGGPGALVWMWISAAFGITSKFSECMLAIKYREVNAKGEMSGGPMYTRKKD